MLEGRNAIGWPWSKGKTNYASSTPPGGHTFTAPLWLARFWYATDSTRISGGNSMSKSTPYKGLYCYWCCHCEKYPCFIGRKYSNRPTPIRMMFYHTRGQIRQIHALPTRNTTSSVRVCGSRASMSKSWGGCLFSRLLVSTIIQSTVGSTTRQRYPSRRRPA